MKTKNEVGDLVKIKSPGKPGEFTDLHGRIPFSPFPWKPNDPDTVWVKNGDIGLIVKIEEWIERTGSEKGIRKYYYAVLCGTKVASINDDYITSCNP